MMHSAGGKYMTFQNTVNEALRQHMRSIKAEICSVYCKIYAEKLVTLYGFTLYDKKTTKTLLCFTLGTTTKLFAPCQCEKVENYSLAPTYIKRISESSCISLFILNNALWKWCKAWRKSKESILLNSRFS